MFRIKMPLRVLLILAFVTVFSGCATAIGPGLIALEGFEEKPVLRLEKVNETLTGTWAAVAQTAAGGFRGELMKVLNQPGPTTLFTKDMSGLGMQIDLTSDHEADEPRLFALGMTSMATLGLIPLGYYSEWNVQCDVTIRMADGTVAAEYPLRETGTYKITVFPLTMFALFGAGIAGQTSSFEVQEKVANNLGAKILEAVQSDYPRLLKFYAADVQQRALPPPVAEPPTPTAAPRQAAAFPSPYRPYYRQRIAAVVGINEYEKWPPLEGAVVDARHVAEEFRKMGFNQVIEVYDVEATRTRILKLLGTELAEKTDQEDLVVIFFAGHGQTETLPNGQKRGYIIPVDSEREDVFATAISMDTLRDLSNRLPAKHVYYAMDSCYSGLGFTRGAAVIPKTAGYLEKMTSRRAVQMITAGAEGEEAMEIGGQGLFTTKFLEALRGEADFDSDGVVTASEVGTFVRPSVTNTSNQGQTPQFGTLEGTGEVVFNVK